MTVARKPLVLIAEDEISIAEILKTALETEGFDTRHVTTGAEVLQNPSADFLILDVGLPDKTGFEVIKALRAASPAANLLPVLFLTARSSEIDKVVGLELGADDYVTKPFSPREVVARVRTILRRSSLEKANSSIRPNSELAVPGAVIIIDDSRKRVTVNGVAVALSKQEYKVLLTLAGRPGKVFTRDELMDRAWEEPGMSTDRVIDTHIKSIRSKLGNGLNSDPIVTHRGLGYAFSEDIPLKVIRE